MHHDLDTHRLVVLAIEPVVMIDLAIPLQVFVREGLDAYEVTVAGLRPGRIATTTGPDLVVDHGLEQVAQANTVLVPGFALGVEPPEEISAALRAAHDRGARIVSVCTGAFALAAAGLLDGRRATTHWASTAELARRFPAVEVDPDVLYVDQGRVLTSAGVTAGIDLCLHLLERDQGAEVALQVARALVVPRHRAGGQAQYRVPDLAGAGAEVATTVAWAEQHVADRLTTHDLARQAHLSVRSLHRQWRAVTGLSPGEWIIRQRVQLACRLLEDPNLPIDAVASRSGLGGAATLRLHLRRLLDTTPSAYRLAFAGTATRQR